MPDGGVILGLLLGAGAVALAAIFGIAAVAVALTRTRRRGAVTGPFIAALAAGGLLLLDADRLRLDLAWSTVVVALVALGVAVPQRLEEGTPGSTSWRIGRIGTEAWIGAAQGLFFGVVATWITGDWRFALLMLPIGAAIRGIWVAIEGPRGGSISGPVAALAAESASHVHAPLPAGSRVLATQAAQSSVQPMPPDAMTPDSPRGSATVGPATAVAPGASGFGGTTTFVVATVIVLAVGAGIAFATASTGYRGPHLATVYNRTTTPIGFADELFGKGAFVAACASETFDLDSRYRLPSASAAPARPANAVIVNLPIAYGGAESGPPPAQSIMVLNNAETVDSSGASPGVLAPCAGVARTKIELSGQGDFTSEPIRLAGSYSEQLSVTASAATACDFAAAVSGSSDVVELAKPFTIPAGGHPTFGGYRSYPDATYALVVTSGCSWKITIDP
jgi:hypothetical protein